MKVDWRAALDAPRRRIATIAAELGAEYATDVFLVGGPVRDLLLQRSISDIDLAVEANSARFAETLALRLGGRCVEHARFLTFRIDLPDDVVDVVRCRRERYLAAGALPTVERGTLRDDLLRRDFTINALALDLATDEVIDVSSGLTHLHNRVLRILHEKSFEDDPTRILRGARFAARLGFAFDPMTEALARRAIETGALETVSDHRLWRETALLFEEEDCARGLELLASLGALQRVLGVVSADRELIRKVDAVARQLGADRLVAIAGALGASSETPPAIGPRLAEQKRARIEYVARHAAPLSRRLRSTTSIPRQWLLVDRAGAETFAAAVALDPALAPLVASYSRYAATRIETRFAAEMPRTLGRRVGHEIRRARVRVACGILTPEEAPAFAADALMRYLELHERHTSND